MTDSIAKNFTGTDNSSVYKVGRENTVIASIETNTAGDLGTTPVLKLQRRVEGRSWFTVRQLTELTPTDVSIAVPIDIELRVSSGDELRWSFTSGGGSPDFWASIRPVNN